MGDGRDVTPKRRVNDSWKRSRVTRSNDMLEADQNGHAFCVSKVKLCMCAMGRMKRARSGRMFWHRIERG